MKLLELDVDTALMNLRSLPDQATTDDADAAANLLVERLKALSVFVEKVAESLRFPQPIRDILRSRVKRRWTVLRGSMSKPYSWILKRMRAKEARREKA